MFDFGIADLMLLGPADQEVYLVEFRCRCAVIVARGQVIRRAVEATHTVDGDVPAVSSYHVAVEIRATYQGFAIATDDTDWAPWDALSDVRFAAVLRKIATRLNITTVRKSRRAPKSPAPKGYVARSVAQRHHSTARLMAAARTKKAP